MTSSHSAVKDCDKTGGFDPDRREKVSPKHCLQIGIAATIQQSMHILGLLSTTKPFLAVADNLRHLPQPASSPGSCSPLLGSPLKTSRPAKQGSQTNQPSPILHDGADVPRLHRLAAGDRQTCDRAQRLMAGAIHR